MQGLTQNYWTFHVQSGIFLTRSRMRLKFKWRRSDSIIGIVDQSLKECSGGLAIAACAPMNEEAKAGVRQDSEPRSTVIFRVSAPNAAIGTHILLQKKQPRNRAEKMFRHSPCNSGSTQIPVLAPVNLSTRRIAG